jgi:cytochrome c oxidase subunit 2
MLAKIHVLDAAAWAIPQSTGEARGHALAQWGAKLYESKACITCHSLDGSKKTGPSFQGVFGHPVTLADGSTITVDEEYIRRSLMEPAAQVVEGYQPVMPVYGGTLTPEDVDGLIAFIKEQK